MYSVDHVVVSSVVISGSRLEGGKSRSGLGLGRCRSQNKGPKVNTLKGAFVPFHRVPLILHSELQLIDKRRPALAANSRSSPGSVGFQAAETPSPACAQLVLGSAPNGTIPHGFGGCTLITHRANCVI